MNNKNVLRNLVDKSLNKLGDLSIKVTESAMESACTLAIIYEPEFPKELLNTEE